MPLKYTVWHVMREVKMNGTGDGKVLLEVLSSHYNPEEAVRVAETLGSDLTPKLEGKTVTPATRGELSKVQLAKLEYLDEDVGRGDEQKIFVLEFSNDSKRMPKSAADLKYHVIKDTTNRRMTREGFNIPELLASYPTAEGAALRAYSEGYYYTRMLGDEPMPWRPEDEEDEEGNWVRDYADETLEKIEYVSGPTEDEDEFDENADIVRVYIHNVKHPRWSARGGFKGPRSGGGEANGADYESEGEEELEQHLPHLSKASPPRKRAASPLAPHASSATSTSKSAPPPDSSKRLKMEGKVVDLTGDSP